MPRIIHVKKAQQRYETRPVIDPDTGEQKRTPVMKGGEQRKTKQGSLVFLRITEPDKDRPKPLLSCDFPGCDINGGLIAIGTPYKHITPKSGPYSGSQKNRHAEHPNWQVWDYSYSRSAQVARTQHGMHDDLDSFEFTSYDDFESIKDSLTEQAQSALDEAQEALDNMPECLQDGSQAQENVEALESWVDEIENAEAPDSPDSCPECDGEEAETRWFIINADGSGPVQEDDDEGFYTEGDAEDEIDRMVENGEGVEGEFETDSREVTSGDVCEECGGTGDAPEEPTDEWVSEAKDVLVEAINGCEI